MEKTNPHRDTSYTLVLIAIVLVVLSHSWFYTSWDLTEEFLW